MLYQSGQQQRQQQLHYLAKYHCFKYKASLASLTYLICYTHPSYLAANNWTLSSTAQEVANNNVKLGVYIANVEMMKCGSRPSSVLYMSDAGLWTVRCSSVLMNLSIKLRQQSTIWIFTSISLLISQLCWTNSTPSHSSHTLSFILDADIHRIVCWK